MGITEEKGTDQYVVRVGGKDKKEGGVLGGGGGQRERFDVICN